MTRSFRPFTLALLAAVLLSINNASEVRAAGKGEPDAGALDLRLPPPGKNSVRFAIIGDSGTGDSAEFQIGGLMEQYRQKLGFDFVIMLGDNIYGGHSADDLRHKFEDPFKPLLDAGVKFYASLGNHDDPNVERLYKPFNMDGNRYYVFKRGDVAFFALDSNYLTPEQIDWFEQNLKQSQAKWKICFFHHPPFNEGKHHGPDLDLRQRLVPLFKQYGVNVVFSGHEHVYERLKQIDGITYFVLGNSAKLIKHDVKKDEAVDTSFDSDRAFGIAEVTGDTLYFQVIARDGHTIDSGSVKRGAARPATVTATNSR